MISFANAKARATAVHPKARTRQQRWAAVQAGLVAGFAGLSSVCTPVLAQSVQGAEAVQLSRADVESLLAAKIQQIVKTQRRIEGQGRDVSVTATVDPQGDVLTLNLSVEYVPKWYGAEFEDLLHELATAAEDFLRDRSSVKRVQFRFGGRDIYDYFPEHRPAQQPKSGQAPVPAAGPVVLGAGHGIYFHYGFNDWRAQRDPSNGIVEDFITPGYATELSTWLTSRSGATTVFARSSDATAHAPSGEPWWKMAARYHLEATYPNNPEIWHSLPNDQSNLRERNEDIRSRPLFANHVGAATLIHIHTNAGSAGASGARAFFHTGRSADQTLADNILCYMGELIHAKQAYEAYSVPKNANARSNLGENSLAQMPSVIVEAGFHTNPSDAAALQDPVFRTASMKGVEKGYRLTGEGKSCELFKISRIPDSTGQQNVPIPVRVHYKGYPQFAVEATVDVVSCPPGWTCNGGVLTYQDQTPSPLKYTYTCNTSTPVPSATFRLRTTLKDVDDVEPDPVEHNVICTPSMVQSDQPEALDRPIMTIDIQ